MPSTTEHRTAVLAVLAVAVVAAIATACTPPPTGPPPTTPPDSNQIELVSTSTADGWQWGYYRNLKWPCAVSGYQTFVIGTRVGSDPASPGTLWVRMRGGGVGWIDPDGTPRPTAGNMKENSFASLVGFTDNALVESVTAADPSARILSVSMCSHDLYAGAGAKDPYNPRTEPDGTPVTTNGLVATTDAIDFTTSRFATDHFFLHGTSAGGAGSFHVAWALQDRGTPPTGVVADSGIVNQEWELAQIEQGGPCARTEQQGALITARWDPRIADPANTPDQLINRGELTVPVFFVWNQGDDNTCGDEPMTCTLSDGSTQVMWSTRCKNEPITAAIAALGPGSRSESMGVCVDAPSDPGPCDQHVVTTGGRPNEDPSLPADYIAHITDWVHERELD